MRSAAKLAANSLGSCVALTLDVAWERNRRCTIARGYLRNTGGTRGRAFLALAEQLLDHAARTVDGFVHRLVQTIRHEGIGQGFQTEKGDDLADGCLWCRSQVLGQHDFYLAPGEGREEAGELFPVEAERSVQPKRFPTLAGPVVLRRDGVDERELLSTLLAQVGPVRICPQRRFAQDRNEPSVGDERMDPSCCFGVPQVVGRASPA